MATRDLEPMIYTVFFGVVHAILDSCLVVPRVAQTSLVTIQFCLAISLQLHLNSAVHSSFARHLFVPVLLGRHLHLHCSNSARTHRCELRSFASGGSFEVPASGFILFIASH